MIIASLAVARAQTVPQLLAWRFVQALGASPGYPTGAGVIGDIYPSEERGTALGTYFGVSHRLIHSYLTLVNMSLVHISRSCPRTYLRGCGLVSTPPYVDLTLEWLGVVAHYWSWRAIHYLLATFACCAFVCIFLFFPETSHPDTRGIDDYRKSGKPLPKWRPVLLNPLSPLLLLRSPNILAIVSLCC